MELLVVFTRLAKPSRPKQGALHTNHIIELLLSIQARWLWVEIALWPHGIERDERLFDEKTNRPAKKTLKVVNKKVVNRVFLWLCELCRTAI